MFQLWLWCHGAASNDNLQKLADAFKQISQENAEKVVAVQEKGEEKDEEQ